MAVSSAALGAARCSARGGIRPALGTCACCRRRSACHPWHRAGTHAVTRLHGAATQHGVAPGQALQHLHGIQRAQAQPHGAGLSAPVLQHQHRARVARHGAAQSGLGQYQCAFAPCGLHLDRQGHVLAQIRGRQVLQRKFHLDGTALRIHRRCDGEHARGKALAGKSVGYHRGFLSRLQLVEKALIHLRHQLRGSGQRFTARVLSIAPSVDAQRGAIEVKFALEQQAPGFLREDMTLSVEVETARRESALVLPLAALRGAVAGDAGTVLVLQEGRAQNLQVRLGLRTLDAVEVLDGLKEGDAVLLGGAMQAGDRVRARMVEWTAGAAAPGAAAQGKGQGGDAGSALTNAMGR